MVDRTPEAGVGGNGIASEFGDLTGFSRSEVDQFWQQLGATVKQTQGGYVEYRFSDRSKLILRPDGEIVRLPAPKYDADGRNLSKGLRLGKDGSLLQTQDALGNPIQSTHNTNETVSE